MDRIDKIIASQTEYTRKEVKMLIKEGRVKVNNIVIKDADIKFDNTKDSIIIDNNKLEYKKNVYLVLNKPKGYISATSDKNDLTVIDLVPKQYLNRDLFPVGRLDKDTTGILIITDDGEFAHNITSPKKHVAKVYDVLIDIEVTEKMIQKFHEGIQLKEEKCKPAVLEITGNNTALITIEEGKYHQIKRMFGAVGAKVLELKRIKIGELFLPKDLKEGEVRELTSDELSKICK